MSFKFLRPTWVKIVIAVVAIGVIGYFWNQSSNKGPFYDTQTMAQGTVVQTVEVTGQIKPETRIALAFKSSGRLIDAKTKVGQTVKKGDVLAQLETRDLQFSVQRAKQALWAASANLDQRLAGETPESLRIAQASVDQAQASYTKALADRETTRVSAESDYQIATIAVDTARRNLDNNGSSLNQGVLNAYENLRNALRNALPSLQTGLVDGDAIIGVDNTVSNAGYLSVLGANDQSSFLTAKNAYPDAKQYVRSADDAVRALYAGSSSWDHTNTANSTIYALQRVQTYLDYVVRTLVGTPASATFSAAEIAAKKAGIEADRSAIGAQITSLTMAVQTANTAELNRTSTQTQLQNAYQTALQNLSTADRARTSKVQTADTNIELQRAALSSAQAALALKQQSPRETDVAALRAQVASAKTSYDQAVAQLQDAQIVAPTDGIVSEFIPSVGEMVVSGQKAVSLAVVDGQTIEVLVPEADISKIKVAQTATMTLDAFGEDKIFKGAVVGEDPDQTKVQDAVYYKVQLSIDAGQEQVKPGMTANVTILTAEKKDVLYAPTRAIRETAGVKFIRVLVNNKAEDRTVEVGLRGDEGKTEILSGMKKEDVVIVGELTAQEYAAKQIKK